MSETMPRMTWAQLQEVFPAEHLHLAERWIQRGGGCAVYQWEAHPSSRAGEYRFVSCGHADATFEGQPPEILPDFEGGAGASNWGFVLKAICDEIPDV